MDEFSCNGRFVKGTYAPPRRVVRVRLGLAALPVEVERPVIRFVGDRVYCVRSSPVPICSNRVRVLSMRSYGSVFSNGVPKVPPPAPSPPSPFTKCARGSRSGRLPCTTMDPLRPPLLSPTLAANTPYTTFPSLPLRPLSPFPTLNHLSHSPYAPPHHHRPYPPSSIAPTPPPTSKTGYRISLWPPTPRRPSGATSATGIRAAWAT